MPHNFEIEIAADEFRKKLNIKDGDRGEPGPKGSPGKDGVGKPGKPGKDAKPPTKTELRSLIRPLIPDPIPGEDGEDGTLITPIEVRDKLESLDGNYRLDAKAIKNLPVFIPGHEHKRDTHKIKVSSDDGVPDYLTNKLVAGNNITLTTSAGGNETITIASDGTLVWNEVTANTTMVVNNGYITNSVSRIDLTLPATAVVGSVIQIVGKGTGGWRVVQAASQQVIMGNVSGATGVDGVVDSTHARDCISMVCVTANNIWQVHDSIGNIDLLNTGNTYSMLLDGVDERVTIGDIAALELQTYTMSAWVKRGATGVRHAIFNLQDQFNGADGLAGWFFEFSANNTLTLFTATPADSGSMNQISTTNTFTSTTTWYHIVLTKTGTTVRIYVDNVLDTTATLPNATIDYSTSTSKRTVIGAAWGSTSGFLIPFNGNIDEVSLWDAALSVAQVSEIYNAGTPTGLTSHSASANLVGWWRMGDGATFSGGNWSVPDDSTNNNAGTSANMEEVDRVTDIP